MSRRLIWVPIIHTPEDMGQLRGAVRDAHARRRQGSGGWEAYARAAGNFWRDARRMVEKSGLNFAKVRLYQDALPVCGFEEKIVRELAHTGAANYRLLVDLMAKGASLSGTESPHLLVEEYELSRLALAGTPAVDHEQKAKTLLDSRDQFISQRIAETLAGDETGLIFLGRAHGIDAFLPLEVHLERLDPLAPSTG